MRTRPDRSEWLEAGARRRLVKWILERPTPFESFPSDPFLPLTPLLLISRPRNRRYSAQPRVLPPDGFSGDEGHTSNPSSSLPPITASAKTLDEQGSAFAALLRADVGQALGVSMEAVAVVGVSPAWETLVDWQSWRRWGEEALNVSLGDDLVVGGKVGGRATQRHPNLLSRAPCMPYREHARYHAKQELCSTCGTRTRRAHTYKDQDSLSVL